MVMVRSLVNWAVRKQLGSRHSCRVSRSPGRGVVGLRSWTEENKLDQGHQEECDTALASPTKREASLASITGVWQVLDYRCYEIEKPQNYAGRHWATAYLCSTADCVGRSNNHEVNTSHCDTVYAFFFPMGQNHFYGTKCWTVYCVEFQVGLYLASSHEYYISAFLKFSPSLTP